MFQIIFDPVHRFFAHRHQPLFVTFTDNPYHTLPQTEIAERQPDQFGNPQTGGVQQFEHGFIPQFKRHIDARRGQ
ncbi:hypothetical protein D3C80_1710860 [compost metagenome]